MRGLAGLQTTIALSCSPPAVCPLKTFQGPLNHGNHSNNQTGTAFPTYII